MGLRRRELRLGPVGRMTMGPTPHGADAAHTILTVTDNGSGSIRFTTAAAHGLTGGGPDVIVAGTSQSSYNAEQFVDAVPTPTTFDSGATPYVGDATGGTWTSV